MSQMLNFFSGQQQEQDCLTSHLEQMRIDRHTMLEGLKNDELLFSPAHVSGDDGEDQYDMSRCNMFPSF